EPPYDFKSEVRSAHLRFLVVCPHLLGAYGKIAMFPGIRGFDAAVEEERDMRVLFRFGGAQLREAGGGDYLAEQAGHFLRTEQHLTSQPDVSRVVFRHGVIVDLRNHAALESVEVAPEEGLAELPGAIRPEVEPEDDIAGPD